MSPRALHSCKGSPFDPAPPCPPRRSGQAEPAVNHPCPEYVPGPLTTSSFLKSPSGGHSETPLHCSGSITQYCSPDGRKEKSQV